MRVIERLAQLCRDVKTELDRKARVGAQCEQPRKRHAADVFAGREVARRRGVLDLAEIDDLYHVGVAQSYRELRVAHEGVDEGSMAREGRQDALDHQRL